MEKITNLEYKKEDNENTRQEKNRMLVNREVGDCFSCAMAKIQEKGLVDFGDIENLYLTDDKLNLLKELEELKE